jgi:uncharacterized protein YjbJ (UPF0337 family)
MNNQVKGKIENLKGRAKQAVGAMTGDKELEAKGAAERVKGAGQEAVGKVQRKVEDAADDARANANVDEDEDIERADDEEPRGGRGNA